MVSNTSPSGTVFASHSYSGYYPYAVFDDGSKDWYADSGASKVYIGYTFPKAVCVKKMWIDIFLNGNYTTLNRTLVLQASNNGFQSWANLQTFNISGATIKTYDIDNNEYYLSYRLYCEEPLFLYGSYGYPINQIQFYGVQ